MKGSNKFLTIAVVLLLLLNIGMLVFMLKGKRRGDKKQGGKDPFGILVKELNMTDSQQTQYKQMKEAHFSAMRPTFDSIRALKKSLFSLVKEENVNDSMVNRYSTLIAEQQAIVDKTTINHFRTVRALFKADQQPKFDDFMQKMIQRRKSPGGKPDSAGRKAD
jgi:Spy/CpxP family protein refolding chaperone